VIYDISQGIVATGL